VLIIYEFIDSSIIFGDNIFCTSRIMLLCYNLYSQIFTFFLNVILIVSKLHKVSKPSCSYGCVCQLCWLMVIKNQLSRMIYMYLLQDVTKSWIILKPDIFKYLIPLFTLTVTAILCLKTVFETKNLFLVIELQEQGENIIYILIVNFYTSYFYYNF